MYAYPAGGSTGDDERFAALCERYRPRLVAFCRRKLRGEHDAEDAAHETLLRAHRGWAGFDDSSDPWPWLRTIAGRVCTDIYRREGRTAAAVVDGPAADDVHEQVAARLRADILGDALEQLPPRFRTPLLLKEYAGWSYEEIAEAQGKTRSAVRSILSRTRRRLGVQVESVARSRGNWPLPGVVPPVRGLRDRLRSWREAVERSGHAAMAAIELSSVATRLAIGANAALAGLIGLSSAAAATVLPMPPEPPPRAWPVAVSTPQPQRPTMVAFVAPVSPMTAGVMVKADAPTQARTFTQIASTQPVEDYSPLNAESTVGVGDSEEQVRIEWDVRATPPVGDELKLTGRTDTRCDWDAGREAACATLRDLAAQVPTH